MYVRRYFNDASKAQAMEMVKNIQSAFLEILNENTWMDSFTKERAREKALEMAVHIGYPEEQKSDSKITPIYEGFNFKEDDYFGNILNLITGSFKIQFGKLRDPIRRNDWLAHGQNAIVNAFYQPQENSIRKCQQQKGLVSTLRYMELRLINNPVFLRCDEKQIYSFD